MQNYTSILKGAHSIKFGFRVREVTENNISPSNFNGTFQFNGGLLPVLDANNMPIPGAPPVEATSVQQYERYLLLSSLGFSPQQMLAAGATPTEFLMTVGNPRASVSYVDVGPFVTDDWKVRPNLTLSTGLRWEAQNHLSDWSDFAPRLGFAWSPGLTKASMRPSTVIRGGFGLFYTRFNSDYTLAAEHNNGVLEQVYTVTNPTFFPNIPPLSVLQADPAFSSVLRVDKNLKAPYIIQSAIGVDRQLGKNTTVSVNYMFSHGVHMLLDEDINAPLPGTYIPGEQDSGVRPYGNVGQINQYESVGLLNQHQVFTNVNMRLSSNFSMFGSYVFNHAMSNTDGPGFFPQDPYNIAADYGRAAYDIRNRVFMAGSANLRWNIRISPFLAWQSGVPFNLTTGENLLETTFSMLGRPSRPVRTHRGWSPRHAECLTPIRSLARRSFPGIAPPDLRNSA